MAGQLRLLPLLLLTLLLTGIRSAAEISRYVDSSVIASGAGTSWTSAYKTLNEALNAANDASTTVKYVIYVARGTYYPTGTPTSANRDSTFLIARGGVKLYGGYPSGGGIRNVSDNLTILSGDLGTPTITSDDAYHVMVWASLAASADTLMVDGFTITHGNANGLGAISLGRQPVDRSMGGGIVTSAVNGPAIMNNCIITANSTIKNGGGMFNILSAPIITSCTFSANTSSYSGGGMENATSSPVIKHCIFTCNTADGGGAMFNYRTSTGIAGALVSSTTFSANSARYSGGAVYDYASNAPVSHYAGCTFTGNTASNGGGIYAEHSYPASASGYLDSCFFTYNVATIDGGGAYISNSGNAASFSVTRCTFGANKAGQNGGGMLVNSGGTVSGTTFYNDSAINGGGARGLGITFQKCSFVSNKGAYGAGLFLEGPTVGTSGAANGTFSANDATISGGGLLAYSSDSSAITISNCRFSGNRAGLSGGALTDSAASPPITNCTFAGDTAIKGNGIYSTMSSSVITSSIIWEGADNSLFNFASSTPAITYSIVAGGYTGAGNLSSNPLFALPLAAGAAPTNGGDYTLLPCSPAINAGYKATSSYSGVTDLAGAPRLYGPAVDMGAYELQNAYPAPITGASTVCLGSSTQLEIGFSGGIWTSSNTSVATVSSTGLVTGVAAGTDTITCSSRDAICPNITTKVITVLALPAVGSIIGTTIVCEGCTTALIATTGGGTWSSDNMAKASVSSTGVVKGVASGTGTIRYTVTSATTGCSNQAVAVVTVKPLTGPPAWPSR